MDFIRTGCDAARLDIEIKNDQVDQSNYIITRIINKYVTFLHKLWIHSLSITGWFPQFIWDYFNFNPPLELNFATLYGEKSSKNSFLSREIGFNVMLRGYLKNMQHDLKKSYFSESK